MIDTSLAGALRIIRGFLPDLIATAADGGTADLVTPGGRGGVDHGPLARLFSGNVRRLFPADTYQAMLTEDFIPPGTAQTRKEIRAVAAAIPQFRARAPQLPTCPTIVLSPARAAKGRERQNTAMREHRRRYADSLSDGHHEIVGSAHFIQAEQPRFVATQIQQLLRSTA